MADNEKKHGISKMIKAVEEVCLVNTVTAVLNYGVLFPTETQLHQAALLVS